MELEAVSKNKDELPRHVKPVEMAEGMASSTRLRKIILVASIAAGIQFGWALQLSLLTPYVQLLGIPHTWSSSVWLCGPISGFLSSPSSATTATAAPPASAATPLSSPVELSLSSSPSSSYGSPPTSATPWATRSTRRPCRGSKFLEVEEIRAATTAAKDSWWLSVANEV